MITMSSKAGPVLDPNIPSSGDDAKEQDPWERAWNGLSDECKKRYGKPSLGRLEALDSVCEPNSASPRN